MKKIKTALTDQEIARLDERRKNARKKPIRKQHILTDDEIELVNSWRRQISKEKFKLGAEVVQTKVWFGMRSNRKGWITSVWPRTMVLFEDGSEPDVHIQLAALLEPTGRIADDLTSIRERIESKTVRKQMRRKESYR